MASSMLACQKSPLDHLMYYDARVGTPWNGLFDRLSQQPNKPYWAILNFSKLYQLKNEAVCTSDNPAVKSVAAVSEDGKEAAVMICYYKDHESIDGSRCEEETINLRLDWEGFTSGEGVTVSYRFTDAQADNEILTEEVFFGEKSAHIFKLPLYTTMLVILRKN
ncbi:MAG: hypothetical protein IKY52_06940 [Clostridia bacterium]|nr:hypothetical protein [Clostridia bacterium]